MPTQPITARELRIGNLLHTFQGIVVTVSGVTGDKHNIITEEGRFIAEGLLPIGLTPEWIERFGFEKIGPCWCKETFTLATKVDENSTPYFSTSSFMIDIVSVHQLQNLYFALTGQELTPNK